MSPRRPRITVWLAAGGVASLLVVLAVACSSSKGTSARDGGAPDDVSVVESAAEAPDYYDAGYEPESGPAGYVFFSMAPAGASSLGAVFDGNPVQAAHCHVTTDYGACVVYTCPTDADAGPTPGAGTLTFAAPQLEGGVTVDAGPGGLYAVAAPSALFSPGDALTVTASGGAVPAFGPLAVTAPGAITLTSPTPDGGPIAVPTSSDLAFAWTGGVLDSAAVLTASGVTADGSLVVARCSYVSITDEGLLPSSVLTSVKGLSQGTLGWGQANAASFDAGAWSVTLLAGVYESTPATFE